MGSGLPQFGFPRRFAIGLVSLKEFGEFHDQLTNWRGPCLFRERNTTSILGNFSPEINSKLAQIAVQPFGRDGVVDGMYLSINNQVKSILVNHETGWHPEWQPQIFHREGYLRDDD
jgi:hypothetical protein